MERKDEKTLTLLGNKKTFYKQDYAPEVLETWTMHPKCLRRSRTRIRRMTTG